jgi:hypothetical protein
VPETVLPLFGSRLIVNELDFVSEPDLQAIMSTMAIKEENTIFFMTNYFFKFNYSKTKRLLII